MRRKVPSKITTRQARFLKARAAGATRQEAVIAAGYSDPLANPEASENVQIALRNAILKAVPIRHIVKRLKQGIDCKETKFFQKDGIVTDERNVWNMSERRQYIELAAKFAGLMPEEGAMTKIVVLGSGKISAASASPVIDVPSSPVAQSSDEDPSI